MAQKYVGISRKVRNVVREKAPKHMELRAVPIGTIPQADRVADRIHFLTFR